MRLPLFIVLVCAACLGAADFWDARPFTEWSDKDVQRMLGNSPWARPVSAIVEAAPAAAMPTEESRAGRPPDSTETAPGRMTAQGDIPSTGASSRGNGGDVLAFHTIVRWQSALPVKQALVRLKPGGGNLLHPDDSNYVIALSGVPRNLAARDDARQAALSVKGKTPLRPSDTQFAPHDNLVDVLFVFPKTTPFTLDDKEVEFSTRIGPYSVKCKFRLKDLVYQGKLEL
jgi:hypothetical protein